MDETSQLVAPQVTTCGVTCEAAPASASDPASVTGGGTRVAPPVPALPPLVTGLEVPPAEVSAPPLLVPPTPRTLPASAPGAPLVFVAPPEVRTALPASFASPPSALASVVVSLCLENRLDPELDPQPTIPMIPKTPVTRLHPIAEHIADDARLQLSHRSQNGELVGSVVEMTR